MPLMMIAFRPLEFVRHAGSTYVLIGGADHFRRIFNRRRDWPRTTSRPMRAIDRRWVDEDGDGR